MPEFTSPDSAEELADRLTAMGVQVPLTADETSLGSVIDTAGTEIFVVDHNAQRTNAEAFEIASLLAFAINFTAEF
jgi:hypothetical protein